MPSTERLPSGRWRGRYIDADGEKRSVPGTFSRKSDAKDAAIEWEAKAKRKGAATDGTLVAKTPWREWWAILEEDRPRNSDAWIKEANIVENFVMPRWGDTPLNGFKRKEVQAWLDGLHRQGYSAGYVRLIYIPLQRTINAAVNQDVLEASPIAGVKLPRRAKKITKKFVEPGEPAKLGMPQVYVDASDFVLDTGLRPGELAGMHADQLDGEWLDVTHAYLQRSKMIRPSPKDEDARRVPLTRKAREVARRQLEGRDLTAGCGVPHTDGSACRSVLVFLNLRGGVLNPDLLSKRLREAAKAQGMKAKSGYGLRRGFATRAIEGGADIFAVQRTMGHADLEQLGEYVQETRSAHSRMLAALGERPELSVVDDPHGMRGTERGTNLDNQVSPTAPRGEGTNTG